MKNMIILRDGSHLVAFFVSFYCCIHVQCKQYWKPSQMKDLTIKWQRAQQEENGKINGTQSRVSRIYYNIIIIVIIRINANKSVYNTYFVRNSKFASSSLFSAFGVSMLFILNITCTNCMHCAWLFSKVVWIFCSCFVLAKHSEEATTANWALVGQPMPISIPSKSKHRNIKN